MTRKRFFLFFTVLVFFHFESSQVQDMKIEQRETGNRKKIHPVSIVSLIANPSGYFNKIVLVMGVGDISYGRRCLYLTKEHRNKSVYRNALGLDFSRFTKGEVRGFEKFNGKYVAVRGLFKVKGKKKSMLSGSILVDLYELDER